MEFKRFLVGLKNADTWIGRRDNVSIFDDFDEALLWLNASPYKGDLIVWEVTFRPLNGG